MKRVLMFLLLGMFLINLVSAIQSDSFIIDQDKIEELNTKTNYGTYTIIERTWWDLFGWWTNKNIKEVTLKNNTDVCGIDCYSIEEINNLEEGSLIDDARFYRIYGDNSQELSDIRSYQLYVKTGEKITDVDDYEVQCIKTGMSPNGTNIEDCKYIKTGSHRVESYEWTAFQIGDVFPIGNYTVKLAGEKNPSWSYEWEVKIGGTSTWTKKWAIWGGVGIFANVSAIEHYYKMDSSSGTVMEDEIETQNGTLINGPSWVVGKINNGLNFDGVNQYVNFTDVINISTTAGSMSIWINQTEFVIGNSIIGLFGDNDMYIESNNSTNFIVQGVDTGTFKYYTVPAMSVNTWYHLVVTRA